MEKCTRIAVNNVKVTIGVYLIGKLESDSAKSENLKG